MRPIILLSALLVSYFTSSLIAQNYHRSFNTVISPDGLNIRETPSVNGRKLGAAPFKAKLEILEDGNGVWDTLGVREFKAPEAGPGESWEIPVEGTWVKVQYKNISGYVFSAFLFREWESKDLKGINDDYILLIPGQDCYDNIHDLSGRTFYGLYVEDGKARLKEIRPPGYFAMQDEMAPLVVSAKDNINLVCIIGSRRKLPVGMRNGYFGGRYLTEENTLYGSGRDGFREDFLDGHGLYGVMPENGSIYEAKLYAGKKGRGTWLGTEQEVFGAAESLIWRGDLDGDGKDDYLISYGEKVAHTALYLSSEAKGRDIVRLVALLFDGYCC